MTAQERAALWEALTQNALAADIAAGTIGGDYTSPDRAYKRGRAAFGFARVAIDAYEALKEADTLETLDEMGYDAECVIRQQWEAKRCGTCRWWQGGDSEYGSCDCTESFCGYGNCDGLLWPADHGCPHWQRKDGAE